ncbi:MAG: extracellular solute-binding protein [Lachnospiraceae bacterium]|nr:extracellular solute-binding protein [Candidatus Darwinimomas equi]
MKKNSILAIIILMAAISVCSCKGPEASGCNPDSMTLDEIISEAKKEGHIESVGMPDSWANWGKMWNEYSEKYGISHHDSDMSSAEELSTFSVDPTKAIGDIGVAFTKKAVDDGLLLSYRTSYWDRIPDWAKDDKGRWMIAYTGSTAFIFNEDICEEKRPESWQDVRSGSYKLTIGDVVGGATGQGVVIATAYAFGGSMDDLSPAFDFWTKMAENGRIDKGDILLNRIQMGEVECGVSWSYNVLSYRNLTKGYNISVGIPSDGAIRVGYASVINANADTPCSAALAREFIFSDRGQQILAEAGALPVRTDFVAAEGSEEVFDPAEYSDAVIITDYEKYTEACAEVSQWWKENIIPLL